MSEEKYIVTKTQIMNAVRHALEEHFNSNKIVDILTDDIRNAIETVL